MSDHELLKLAAKSAGMNLREIGERTVNGITYGPSLHTDHRWSPWNPLEDDGDAFRLMVALSIDVHVHQVSVCAGNIRDEARAMIREVCEDVNGRAAATRRAIVRAAAVLSGERP